MYDRSACVRDDSATTPDGPRGYQHADLSQRRGWRLRAVRSVFLFSFALTGTQVAVAGDNAALAPIESRLVGDTAAVHLQYTDIQKTRNDDNPANMVVEEGSSDDTPAEPGLAVVDNTRSQDPIENGNHTIEETLLKPAVNKASRYTGVDSTLGEANTNTLEKIGSDNIEPDMLGIRLGVLAQAQLPAQATIFRDNAAILNQPNVMETVVTTTTYGVDKTETVTEVLSLDELNLSLDADTTDGMDTTAATAQPEKLEFTTANVVNDDQPLSWETVTINKGDTLISVFQKLGIDTAHAVRIAESDDNNTLNNLSVGRELALLTNPTGSFGALRYDMSASRRFEARYHDDGNVIVDHIDLLPRSTEELEAYGSIRSSLFEAATGAGVDPVIIAKFANIFGYEIDFAMDLRRGDRFALIYKQNYSDGVKARGGDILAAEFINDGKRYRAIRYEDTNGKANFYTPDGYSLKRAFFRSPVEFTRITSSFSNRRFHPVLKKWKAHRGVDYAAPTGTPVMATAEGVISHRSAMGGYGRTVIIRHENNYETVYAHLSGYGRSQRVGHQVSQGQVIGYVGRSGNATGPHLHYEFRVKGRHRNPLDVMSDESPAERIPDKYMSDFQDTVSIFASRLDSLNAEIAQGRAEQQPDRS